MRWNTIALLLVVIGCIGEASAVKLEYTRFFPECSFKDEELSGTSVVRCGMYLFVPNWHAEAGYDLVIEAFGDGIILLFKRELNYTVEFLSFLSPDVMGDRIERGLFPIDLSFSFLWQQLGLLFYMVMQPFLLVLDVLSGVIAYLLLLLFEFVKTYLFWIVLPLSSVNLMLHAISALMNQRYNSPLLGLLVNPITMGLAITIIMIIGSIFLITLDIGIFNMRLI